jgi:hypothetical protein
MIGLQRSVNRKQLSKMYLIVSREVFTGLAEAIRATAPEIRALMPTTQI